MIQRVEAMSDEPERSDATAGVETVTDVLHQAREAGGSDTVEVSDLVAALGKTSFGALLLVPGLIIVSPLSGIPGLPTVGGITIALIAAQMVFGRRSLWLPAWILRRRMRKTVFDRAVDWLLGPARFVDRITRPRLGILVKPPFSIIPEALCMVCGLMMPVLELVPFSSTILATAVTFFAISLLVRDGLLAVIGITVMAGAVAALFGIFG